MTEQINQLNPNFTENNHTFTQLRRTDLAAIYKRETLEGRLVSYEVFAIKSKDGQEIYPNQSAMSKWAWCPTNIDRANKYFDRINDGEIAIPNVDPITGETIRTDADNRSLEDVLAEGDPDAVSTEIVAEENIVEDVTAPTEIVQTLTDSPADDVVVDVPTADVTPTPDGGAVVTVATVKKVKVAKTPKTPKIKVAKAVKAPKTTVAMVIPSGSFTQAIFAQHNNLPERGVVWGKLDGLVKDGKLTKVFQQMGKGRPCAIYQGV